MGTFSLAMHVLLQGHVTQRTEQCDVLLEMTNGIFCFVLTAVCLFF